MARRKELTRVTMPQYDSGNYDSDLDIKETQGAEGLRLANLESQRLEVMAFKQKLEDRKKGRMVEFVSAALGMRANEFGYRTEAKADMLEDYFPGRFGPDGSQNLPTNPLDVGALFNRMVNVARKY